MNWRSMCYGLTWKLQFILIPRLRYSQAIYEDILWEHSCKDYSWLDLGCGHNLLPSWRLQRETELVQRARILVGIDCDSESIAKHETITNRVLGDISALPFADDSFDLVTSNMVLEHLNEPELQLAEIMRILKPGGKLIFHTPNVFGYTTIIARLIPERIKNVFIHLLQERMGHDVFPAYYKLNSTSSIRHAASNVGLSLQEMKLIVSFPECGAIPPLALLEILYIRMLLTKPFRPFRTGIIAVLSKPK